MRQDSNRLLTPEQREQICLRLKELRREGGYSQRELAQVLRLDRSSYAYYELGRVQMNIEVLYILSDLYGVSADYILGLSDDREKRLPKEKQLQPQEEVQGEAGKNECPE